MWTEDLIDESLFGLSLNNEMQPDSHYGRPPMTFFSHNSESE